MGCMRKFYVGAETQRMRKIKFEMQGQRNACSGSMRSSAVSTIDRPDNARPIMASGVPACIHFLSGHYSRDSKA